LLGNIVRFKSEIFLKFSVTIHLGSLGLIIAQICGKTGILLILLLLLLLKFSPSAFVFQVHVF